MRDIPAHQHPGIVFAGLVCYLWTGNQLLSASVLVSSFLAILIAPIVALGIAYSFQSARQDPAAGTGPIATVIQDALSILIYGLVTSWIMLE